jgi:lambda family phage tail tape measure protein
MANPQIELSAVDKTKAAFDSAKRNLQGLHEQASSLPAVFGSIGLAITAAFAAGSIVGVINAADHLKDLSKSTGIAVEQLAGLKLAAKQSGGDLDSIAQSVNKLSVAIGKDPDKFAQLGVTAKDPLEAFKQLADVFSSIQDPQLRAALGAEALGKSWAGAAPLLAEGGKKIGEMVEKGKALSGMTQEAADRADEFNDRLAELTTAADGAKLSLAGEMLPALTDVTKAVIEAYTESGKLQAIWVALGGLGAFLFTDEFTSAKNKLNDVNKELADLQKRQKEVQGSGSITKFLFGADQIDSDIAKAIAKAKELQALIDKPANDAAAKKADKEGQARAKEESDAAAEKARKFLAGNDAAKRPDHFADNFINQLITEYAGLTGAMTKTDEVTRKLDTSTEKFSATERARALNLAGLIDAEKTKKILLDSAAAEMQRYTQEREAGDEIYSKGMLARIQGNQELAFEATLIGKTTEEVERLRFARELALQVVAEENQVMEMQTKGYISMAEALERIAVIKRNAGDAVVGHDEVTAAKEARLRDPLAGINDAFVDYEKTVGRVALSTKSMMTDAFKGMEDALVSFTKTGKLDFKSLADGVIGDLIRIQIQQNVTGPLAGAMKGGGGWLSTLLGGGSSGGTAPAALSAIDMVASASGNVFNSPGLSAYSGQIVDTPTTFAFARGAGLMGEAGPEAIMPLKRGADGKLGVAGAGGGGTTFSPVTTIHVAGGLSAAESQTALRQALDENNRQWSELLKRQGVLG